MKMLKHALIDLLQKPEHKDGLTGNQAIALLKPLGYKATSISAELHLLAKAKVFTATKKIIKVEKKLTHYSISKHEKTTVLLPGGEETNP